MYPGIVQQENLANTEEQLRRLLFGKGQEGVWFDPSDLSTMFQNPEGSLAVENDGDPMKFMLDKHAKHLWPQHQQVDSIQGDPIDAGAPNAISTYPVAQSLQPGVRYLITADIVDFQGTGDVGFRSVPGDGVMVPSRKEGNRFFAVCVEFTEVVDLEFFTRVRINTCNIQNIKVYDVTQGNHYIYTANSDNVYHTDGTLHWIQTPTYYRYQFIVPSFSERASCFGAVSGTSSQYMSLASNNAATDRYIMVASSGATPTALNHAVYSQTGINRVNGSNFTGNRGDMYDVYNTGQKYVVGATGLDLNNIAGGVLKIGLQYATQGFGGGTWHDFIIWEGNNTIPIIERVEQYLADKAGITLP